MDGITFREDVEIILDEPGISVFYSPGGDMLATIRVDENLDPLPGSDPADYGYAALSYNYEHNGLAIISVVRVADLIEAIDGVQLGMEVASD